MKNAVVIAFIAIFAVISNAQINQSVSEWEKKILGEKNLSKKEFKPNIVKHDFGALWTQTENSAVYGFIGSDFRRIRVKILTTEQDKNERGVYAVTGKTMLGNNVCAFRGTMKIDTARVYKKLHFGGDDEYKNKGIRSQGIVFGEYRFAEETCLFSGVFEGRFVTRWYLDKKGALRYDDIEKEKDSYANNQFAGTWRSHRGGIEKICNWGDYRIPLSDDFDLGAGEFSPAEKYRRFGWQTYHDAYFGNDEQARREEEREWWK